MKKKDYELKIHNAKARDTFYKLRRKYRHNKAVKKLIRMIPKSQLPDIIIKNQMIFLPKGAQEPIWIEIKADDLRKIRKDKRFMVYRNVENVPRELIESM
ncbi:MAG: hypothetical protein ACOC2M_00715 [bacterium]